MQIILLFSPRKITSLFTHSPAIRNLFKQVCCLGSIKMVKEKMKDKKYDCGGAGTVYGLGFIGSVVYYISTVNSFWMGVLGILKAIVWPAFLAYEALKFFGA